MTIDVSTTERVDIVNITTEIADVIPAGVNDGLCTVFVPHTTAGIVVNENEERLFDDLQRRLDHLVPADEDYAHNTVDNNVDAHLRAMLLGESVNVPVVDGGLALGQWQSVLFIECDGPRTRQVSITIIEGE